MNNRRRKTKDEEMERWRRTFHYVRIKICLLPDNEIKVKRFIYIFRQQSRSCSQQEFVTLGFASAAPARASSAVAAKTHL